MKFVEVEPTILDDLYPEANPPEHEGLFYRAKESYYHSASSGIFHKRVTLTPLKRKSCKGCPTCDCIFEMVSELGDDMEGFLDNLKDGKMYELSIIGDKTWTDCGYEYDTWLELNEVKD